MVRSFLCFLACLGGLASALASDAPQWTELHSNHFTVLTDADQKKGSEVVVRLEQMRSVFADLLHRPRLSQPVPLNVIALRDDQQYYALAPQHDGKPIDAPGFVLRSRDHDLVVLNLVAAEPWRAVAHDLAHIWIDGNYPPTQTWFDEGLAQYFASIRADDKHVELGGDPEAPALADLLSKSAWLPWPELLATHRGGEDVSRHTIYYAQSWMLMHYLITEKKFEATGTYFDLTQNQNVAIEQAVQQAYGMSVAQLDTTVHAHFKAWLGTPPFQYPSPVDAETMAPSSRVVLEPDARAMLAEVAVRIPEHRQQGTTELTALVQKFPESASPHRVLAWVAMQKKDWPKATEEIGNTLERDRRDPWSRFHLAQTKHLVALESGRDTQGLANMMTDLRVVLDWYPEFAEAYNLLALARMEGGGFNAALESIQAATRLAPRNDEYRLNMARIYMEGKKFEAAQALLERLKASPDAQVAAAAKQQLGDMAQIKKYGIPPRHVEKPKPATEPEDEDEKRPVEAPPDTRPVHFIKGRIVSVDCSHAPEAVITLATAARTLKMHVANTAAVLLIGTDAFSCTWHDVRASVNYKFGGKMDGDVVSVEVQ